MVEGQKADLTWTRPAMICGYDLSIINGNRTGKKPDYISYIRVIAALRQMLLLSIFAKLWLIANLILCGT